jgi:hypothetical protein
MKRKNNLQFIRNILFYGKRRNILAGIPDAAEHHFTIPHTSGLLQWNVNTFPYGKDIVRECKAIIEDSQPAIDDLVGKLTQGNTPENFVTNPFYSPDMHRYLSIDHPIIRFGLHPSIIKAAGNYLGTLPILTGVHLLYSPNKSSSSKSSQLYHLDMHDRRCMKIFVYINDVDSDCGPLNAIPGNLSEKIEQKLQYKTRYVNTSGDLTSRVTDEVIESIIPRNDHVVFTGQSGAALFVDTDRCFHYGSRAATRPRTALQFYYETPFGFGYKNEQAKNLFSLKYLAKDTTSLMEKYVLGEYL